MIRSLNKTPEILKKLAENGNVRTLNDEASIQALRELNERAEEVDRDARMRQMLSEESARKVPLD